MAPQETALIERGMSYQGRRHGNVKIGRITVGVVMILTLAANWMVYRQATITPYPIPGVQWLAVVGYIWLSAGGIAICLRKVWGRLLALLILNAGTFGLFMTGIAVVAGAEQPVSARAVPMFIAAAIYLAGSIAITNSVHVRRLTRRTWE